MKQALWLRIDLSFFSCLWHKVEDCPRAGSPVLLVAALYRLCAVNPGLFMDRQGQRKSSHYLLFQLN